MKVVVFYFWTVVGVVVTMLMTMTPTTSPDRVKLLPLPAGSAPNSFVGTFVKYLGNNRGPLSQRVTSMKTGLDKLCHLVNKETDQAGKKKTYACRRFPMTLSCPVGSDIVVTNATHVPVSDSRCKPDVLKDDFDADCSSVVATPNDAVATECDDQEACTFLTGTPGSIPKYCVYLEVEYSCRTRAVQGGVKVSYACEGNRLMMKCSGEGSLIQVKRARYLKSSIRCPTQDTTNNCDHDFTPDLAVVCDGKTECQARMSGNKLQAMADSACKKGYMEVEFTCEPSDGSCGARKNHQTVDPGYSGKGYFSVLNWIEILIKMVQEKVHEE